MGECTAKYSLSVCSLQVIIFASDRSRHTSGRLVSKFSVFGSVFEFRFRFGSVNILQFSGTRNVLKNGQKSSFYVWDIHINEKIFTKNVKNGVLQVSMKSYLYICCFLSKSTSIFVQDIRWISLSEGTEVTNRVPAVNDYGFGSVRVLKTL